MERVTNGGAVPVFYKGEACGEKRWFNNRLLNFLPSTICLPSAAHS